MKLKNEKHKLYQEGPFLYKVACSNAHREHSQGVGEQKPMVCVGWGGRRDCGLPPKVWEWCSFQFSSWE